MCFIIFILGTFIGSFLNVIIFRLPAEKSITKGRSKCPHCGQVIKGYDLIPILSFIILKAKCRNCKQKISWQYPTVELFTGLLFLFVVLEAQGNNLNLLIDPILIRNIIFVSGLIVIFFTDLKYMLIFDAVVFPLAIFAFLVNLFLFSHNSNLWWSVGNLVLAGFLGGLFFFIQYWISRGKWIGFGDVKLGILLGLMFGLAGLATTILISYVIGAIVSLILLAFELKKWQSQMPLGSFLCLGAFIVLVWGEQIVSWYLSLLVS